MVRLMLAYSFFAFGFCHSALLADDSDSTSAMSRNKFDGKWLFESATLGQANQLDRVWSSVVSISGDRFSVPNFLDPSKELTGKLRFDEDGGAIDLSLEELDFASIGTPFKIPAVTLKGLLNLDDENRVVIALSRDPSSKRPTKLKSSDSVFLIRLSRAPRDFTEYPKEIKISITSADGKPVGGAVAARFLSKQVKPDRDAASWKYSDERTTDANGVVVFPFNNLPRVVRDEKTKQVCFPKLSPPALACGELRVTLQPECRLLASVVCEELLNADKPLGWTSMYLEQNGESVAYSSAIDGNFDFIVPPGEYELVAYGSELHRRTMKVSVPKHQTNFTADPIGLKLSAFAHLKGKPAPEFVDVAGWSGEPVVLSGLKGKYVLVDFWGYWCGPCVGAMPVLIGLHERFSDRGLAIVGVHVDEEGEVDSADKLKDKLSQIVKEQWNGREIPFSNALVSGKVKGEGENRSQSGTPNIYGVLSYPTTVLIDPEGNIVGAFHARDINVATAAIEKLLEIQKKP